MDRLFSPMGVPSLLKPWVSPGSALWPMRKGSVLNVYSIKRFRGVFGKICCNERIRMHQSKGWRCTFIEMWLFLWFVGCPGIPRGGWALMIWDTFFFCLFAQPLV